MVASDLFSLAVITSSLPMSMHSPAPGGAADKVGNRYESLWTVYQLLDILEGNADAITIEPHGAVGDGIEFYVEDGDRTVYHQAKRQAPGTRWTLNALSGILDTFREKLQDPKAECVFVSGDRAQELEKLTDRAFRSSSLEEMEAGLSQADREHFDELAREWEVETDQAYRWLQRIDVETFTEPTLLKVVNQKATILVDGPADDVRQKLADVAYAYLTQRLDATKIHHELFHDGEGTSYNLRDWKQNTRVLSSLKEANDRFLRPLDRDGIFAGEDIARGISDDVFETVASTDGPKLTTVVGDAGIGKSFVVGQVTRHLREARIPCFAFRADRIPDHVMTPKQLGEHFGLTESPTTVLSGLADERAVLVIDQLDAVSLVSGRSTNLFDCIDELIREAERRPDVRVLIGCRSFDLRNDSRLRRLTRDRSDDASNTSPRSQKFSIPELDEEDIREAVQRMGVDPGSLGEEQISLLAVPLHLKLFGEILEMTESEGSALEFTFSTLKDLYDEYWDQKRRVIRDRYDGIAFQDALFSLSGRINQRQQLAIPKSRLDRAYENDRDVLVSENVLVEEDDQIAFFHETFFDYVFALDFMSRGARLVDYVREENQALFLRAPIRQVLVHLREGDFQAYVEEAEELLYGEDIRFHVQQLVLALIGRVDDPTPEEWKLIEPLLDDPKIDGASWLSGIFYGTEGWFRLLDERGLLETWLASNDQTLVDLALNVLSEAYRHAPDRWTELLEPYLGDCNTDPWRSRLLGQIRQADYSIPAVQTFFRRFVEAGAYHTMDSGGATFGDDLSTAMHQDLPASAATRILSSYLRKFLELHSGGKISIADDKRILDHPLLSKFRSGHHGLSSLPGDAAREWIEHVLPVLLRFVTTFPEDSSGPPIPDRVFMLYSVSLHHTPESLFLGGTATAFQNVSEARLREAIDELLVYREYQSVQYLLLKGYSAGGPAFADEAVDFLLNHAKTQGLGDVAGHPGSVVEIIEAVSPHCSETHFRTLEQGILQYSSEWERKTRRAYGRSQFALLSALPDDRISPDARRRLQEWTRKFGEPPEMTPSMSEAFFVGPPATISQGSPVEMDDEAWLGAIEKYDSEDAPSRDISSGGGYQLAGVLKEQAKQDPERFSKLAEQIPDDAYTDYFIQLLWGIAEGNPTLDDVLRIVERCHELPDRPCGRFITHPFAKNPGLDYPESIVDVIRWYALHGTATDAGHKGDLDHSGINTVRGTTATSIASLISADPKRAEWFWDILEEMTGDPSPAVRTCVAQALLMAGNHDERRAVELFLRLAEGTPEEFLASRDVTEFLRYKLGRYYDDLKPLVDRMLGSSESDIVEQGAAHVCLAAFATDDAVADAEKCLDGLPDQRRGAAKVYARNVSNERVAGECKEALFRLFKDPDETVRESAARCFFHLDRSETAPSQCARLVQGFIESPALATNPSDLLRFLDEATEAPPDLIIPLGDRMLGLIDDGTVENYRAHTAGELVLRAYAQARAPKVKKALLDLIDRFLRRRNFGMMNAMKQFERA
jgi:hypothetical protein